MVENYPTISGSRRYRGNSEPDLVGLDYMSLSSHVLLNSMYFDRGSNLVSGLWFRRMAAIGGGH